MKEIALLDEKLSDLLDVETREELWSSVDRLIAQGPTPGAPSQTTALALGYVQSGKTTSMTALTAAAADEGYQLIVALLGSTNLLLKQNTTRLVDALGIDTRNDLVWFKSENPGTEAKGKKLREFLERGRVGFVPILKHAGRIRDAANELAKLPNSMRVLIIDDEADQISLNTMGTEESRTYSAIKELREAVPNHLYVQYTATPYAPLLLDAADILSPEYVEFLTPGKGYTGGKEFFIDNADLVVRDVPRLDEQGPKSMPIELQRSLLTALANFIAGAALLWSQDKRNAPISMLVHSTARNDVQARYEFLLRDQVAKWRRAISPSSHDSIPKHVWDERARLVRNGALDVSDESFAEAVQFVLGEVTTWLVNSRADVNKVDWHIAPIHILVGGNKLDRGFTIEGLTVTYMNRKASDQIDTMEQRARAFGYRRDMLPYCQFFASKTTIRTLTGIVHTEEDLRGRLRDHIEAGGTVKSWATEVGLLLPPGTKPTRSTVITALTSEPLGWHWQRMPSRDPEDNTLNLSLLRHIGLLDAPFKSHGRLKFRTLNVEDPQTITFLLSNWENSNYSPTWFAETYLDAMQRKFRRIGKLQILLMEENGKPRVRKWDEGLGFVNIFQGRDIEEIPGRPYYPGDRAILGIDENPDQLAIQVHRVTVRNDPNLNEIYALALYLGAGKVIRKEKYDN